MVPVKGIAQRMEVGISIALVALSWSTIARADSFGRPQTEQTAERTVPAESPVFRTPKLPGYPRMQTASDSASGTEQPPASMEREDSEEPRGLRLQLRNPVDADTRAAYYRNDFNAPVDGQYWEAEGPRRGMPGRGVPMHRASARMNNVRMRMMPYRRPQPAMYQDMGPMGGELPPGVPMRGQPEMVQEGESFQPFLDEGHGYHEGYEGHYPGGPWGGEGEVIYDGEFGGPYPDNFDGSCGCGGGHAGSCCGPCDCCLPCCCKDCWGWFKELQLFAGTHAFKSAPDLGVNGNFGFHEGINFAAPLWCEIGFQVGAQVVHSDFSGNSIGGGGDKRNQTFLTAGLFHRSMCGLQYGVVYDYLSDDFYIDYNLSQVRAEMSWVFCSGNEIGFTGSFGSDRKTDQFEIDGVLQNIAIESLDLYQFFIRRPICNRGQARVWGGFTGGSDGIVGGDIWLPIGPRWDLLTNGVYVIPQEGGVQNGYATEAWSLSVNLIWRPFAPCEEASCGPPNAFRPLFNVADNSNFVLDATVGP